jgi:PhnB protein
MLIMNKGILKFCRKHPPKNVALPLYEWCEMTLSLTYATEQRMLKTTPYLHFDGRAEEAMTFYKSILGGEFLIFSRYKDIPGGEKVSAEDRDKVIHITLKVSDNVALMATDLLKSMGPLQVGNNIHICLHTESEAETDRLFEKLSNGGSIEMPLNKTFWGSYFGMCRDKFGVQWMLEYAVG